MHLLRDMCIGTSNGRRGRQRLVLLQPSSSNVLFYCLVKASESVAIAVALTDGLFSAYASGADTCMAPLSQLMTLCSVILSVAVPGTLLCC